MNKTPIAVQGRRLPLGGTLIALALAAGCATEVDEPRAELGTSQQSLTGAEEAPATDETSPNPVVLVWSDSRQSVRGQVLSVDAINTTDRPIGVELSLTAAGPDGEVTSASLGRRVLRAGASAAVSIPIARVPVQSVGVATPITVVATYQDDAQVETGTPFVTKGQALMASTESRYLEFDDTDFASATLRTTEAEADGNAGRAAAKQLVALRQLDANGQAVERELGDHGPAAPHPVLVVSRGPGVDPQQPE